MERGQVKGGEMLLLLLVVLLLPSTQGGPVGTFLSSPRSMLVNSGSEARLGCRVRAGAGPCQWTRDGYGLGTEPSLPHLPRYSMPGLVAGNCDLLISPVLPLDAGSYVCQAAGSKSQPASLQVNVQPGQPHILEARESGRMQVETGERIELTCQSQGGRPFAELQWTDDQGQRLEAEDVEEHVTRIEDTSMFKTLSKLKMKVEESTRIICTAHSEAFPELRKSAPLDVMVGGEVELEVVRVCEGESFVLECGDEANELAAEDLAYKWLIDGKEVEGEEEETLKMIDFTPNFDKALVQCMGTDVDGKSRLLKKFQLEHSPIPTPGSITGRRLNSRRREKRKAVTCVLEEGEDVEGSDPEYVWVGGSLERKGKISATDEGDRRYKCKVVPGGFNRIKMVAAKMKEMSKTIKRLTRNLNKMAIKAEDL